VALMEGLGWRQAWTAVGIAYLVLLPGLVLWLLRGHGDRHRAFTAHHAKVRAVSTDGEFTVGKVLHDRRFYLILPAFTAPTILFTGFIFHQVHLAASKGWTLTWFASWFFAYAGISMLTSFLLGPVLDRLNARRLTPFFLIPFGFAMILLATTAHPLSAPAVMVLLGVGVGCFYTIFGAYWAEVYGVTHLGAIRSVTHAVTVLASATSPFLFGWLIDGGLSIETLALLCLGYAAAASVLAALASRQTQAAVENA
ncbi:MAG: hypothetical protein OEY85_14750, partial [Rhodospirillales bacterium]|nr:hypothetical protein [Rhodospirillales bacterium]